ncbi:MAG: chemotaxis protein CheA [Armatimonadetes bacterium]|nr:chemotaxis protein CheA [Armatimonadota bacterium]
MSNGINMSDYLDLFLQETEEQLSILESEIGKLEAEPTTERINSIFRAAHTIKGSSKAMGFSSYAELVHEFENILYLVRDGALTVDHEVGETLIQTVDAMITGKEHLASSGEDYVAEVELLASLKMLSGGKSAAGASQAAPTAKSGFAWPESVNEALTELPNHENIYTVHLTLDPSCVMKYVRVFMVMTALGSLGEVLASNPVQDKLEAEEFDFDVKFLISLESSIEEATQTVNGIGEIASVTFEKYTVSEDKADDHAATTQVAAAAEGDGAKSDKPKREASQTIRVDVSLLDALMNLVGELVIDRTRLSQIGANIAAKVNDSENTDALAETVGHIARVTGELQEQIMRARMLPIDTVFQRFPRMVRDLSRKLNKQVSITIEGGETEVDRSVIEGISDPLIHMVRNSLDHGLEDAAERKKKGKPEGGSILLTAKHKDNAIWVELSDDGRGIDPDKLRAKAVEKGLMTKEAAARLTDRDAQLLIFSSGFSTAKEVTDVSGRGVGMDIVRANIQAMGGIIDIESTPGEGTKIILKLPLTVAIMGGLLSRVGAVDYVMPIGSVLETIATASMEVQKVGKRPVLLLRGQTVPLLKLRELFKVKQSFAGEHTDDYVVVVGSADQKVGLVVDRLLGEQEVVIKSISKYCGELKGLSGATILGNGRVALIVDVNSVLEFTRGLENGH